MKERTPRLPEEPGARAANAQARYRRMLLLFLPAVGIMIVGSEMFNSGISPAGVGFLIFFGAFLIYRVIVLLRTP